MTSSARPGAKRTWLSMVKSGKARRAGAHRGPRERAPEAAIKSWIAQRQAPAVLAEDVERGGRDLQAHAVARREARRALDARAHGLPREIDVDVGLRAQRLDHRNAALEAVSAVEPRVLGPEGHRYAAAGRQIDGRQREVRPQ